MQINRGLFRQNGNIGYVLKPQYLLFEPLPQEEFLYDPTDVTHVKSKSILTIEVGVACTIFYQLIAHAEKVSYQ